MFALAVIKEGADYFAAAQRARKRRWFVWARGRLRLALVDHGGVRPLGEQYLASEQTLAMRALRINGTPVTVKIKHRDDFRLPSDLAASERGDT